MKFNTIVKSTAAFLLLAAASLQAQADVGSHIQAIGNIGAISEVLRAWCQATGFGC